MRAAAGGVGVVEDFSPDRLPRGRSPILDVVTDLEADVAGARFPLELPGVTRLRELRDRLATQITVHLLPRLKQAVGPAIVVVAGATGTGKSTLLNSVIGEEVTPAGLRRPTTREPVLISGPDDAALLAEHPLSQLARTVSAEGTPGGVAFVDAPDLDSVGEDRVLGSQLLEAADLWVFVTTAARYGDAVPWQVLTKAQARGVSTAVVLNRVPRASLTAVRAHLLERLQTLSLGSAPLFIVPDVGPHEGLLPTDSVAELRGWFELVGSRHLSAGIVRRTNRAVWASLREDLLELADGLSAQSEQAAALDREAVQAVEGPAAAVAESLEAGAAGRGAPTTRWLAAASTGGPLAVLLTRPSRIRRGWRGRALAARSAAAIELGVEADAALVALVADALREADDAVRDAWAAQPGAAGLIPAVTPADDDAHRVVEAWSRHVEDLVPEGTTAALDHAGRAALTRAAAAGVDGATGALVAAGVSADVVDAARQRLIDGAADAVRRRADAFRETVEALDLDPAAGTGLRLRASELKGHT